MNAEIDRPLPLRIDAGALVASERRSFLRATTALAIAAVRKTDPAAVLKATWPDDRGAAIVLRAASSPTTTANFPVQNIIGLFQSIAPKSAALELFNAGRTVDLTGINSVVIPRAVAPLPVSPFVAEGAPGPVVMGLTGSFSVGQCRKLLIMAGVTRELDQASPQVAVNIVATILGDCIAASLDAVAFGSAAATAAAPAGLFNNVVPLTPSASATPPINAMYEDVGNLAGAIGDAGIDVNDLVFIGGPKQATAMKMFLGPHFDYPILASQALKNCLAAVAVPALAAAYADLPQVEATMESTLQYSNTPAADPLTAGPTLSAFQQELINIKLRGRAAWAVAPGGAQIVANVTW